MNTVHTKPSVSKRPACSCCSYTGDTRANSVATWGHNCKAFPGNSVPQQPSGTSCPLTKKQHCAPPLWEEGMMVPAFGAASRCPLHSHNLPKARPSRAQHPCHHNNSRTPLPAHCDNLFQTCAQPVLVSQASNPDVSCEIIRRIISISNTHYASHSSLSVHNPHSDWSHKVMACACCSLCDLVHCLSQAPHILSVDTSHADAAIPAACTQTTAQTGQQLRLSSKVSCDTITAQAKQAGFWSH